MECFPRFAVTNWQPGDPFWVGIQVEATRKMNHLLALIFGWSLLVHADVVRRFADFLVFAP